MNTDEEATIVGRLVLERKELTRRGTSLSEELRRFSSGYTALGQRLKDAGSANSIDPVILNVDELQLLQNHPRLIELLSEASEVNRRYQEVKQDLERAGL